MSLRALVTGGSSGIGRATAELLASKGIEVGVLAHDDCGVDEVVNAIAAKGDRAYGLCIDLAVEANVIGLFDRIEAQHGPIDILVNVAGIGLQADVIETEVEDLNRLFAVNYFAAVILSRDALKSMANRRRGHIISVSSASARRALPGMSIYSSTKAALHAFSQALRVEARDLGVHVTEILPMSVRTPFFENAANRSPVPYSLSDAGMVSTPESVAEHIWKTIRRPVDEVYTSLLARLALAIDAALPSIFNRILVANRRKRLGR